MGYLENGQALLILIVMMSVATMLLVYGSTTELERAVSADSRTRAALEEAKQALVGRALADANRPGSMPCPDGDDDGSADFFVGSACPSYIGRLPWRTLGIGDVRDDAGERLWYALSPAFRDHPSAPPLNSDSRGSLTVYSNHSERIVTTQGVAVIFAPGAALGTQLRNDGNTLCASNSKNVPRNRCAVNYLDTTGTINNATAAGPYIASAVGDSYNDRVAVVVSADFMPLVERRVALEARNALLAYRAGTPCKCYPWADTGNGGNSEPGANRGRIPIFTPLPHKWPAGALPPYFAANDWGRVMFYAVARTALDQRGKGCTTCSDTTLHLDGAAGYDVVLITPGYAGKVRSTQGWADYIDDMENRNDDDRFVTPASTQPDADRAYAISASTAGCATLARVLIDNAPCGGVPAGSLRTVCEAAGAGLSTCRCRAAAATLVRPPCASALDARECALAVTELRRCTS